MARLRHRFWRIVGAAMEQEVRFALVLYGGVSLAVYMSGVTREFFHLARATSPDAPGELSGAEAVYRELAGIVNSRFVVDIASGSSAGGINAIFLGKALANGQTLDDLNRLWLDWAGLNRLWNKALLPQSLLSGNTLYKMAADALKSMDDRGQGAALQPEMDVFITSTDLQGLALPLRLADEEVAEKRHKNVFHFRFGEDRNDFTEGTNAMLAFAARATSSFPVAFEPARLADYGGFAADTFFPDYASTGADYACRAFGDGGYLNNKPFCHALAAIPRRIADAPVRRILAYVEPSPEEACGNATERAPGPIRNSMEALITLHQYETIREDLQQVIERNRLVERVHEAIGQVDRDVENWRGREAAHPARLPGEAYAQRTLSDEVHARGPGYAGYHRLKVRAVTEELSRLAGRDVKQWRERSYAEEDAASSESRFLLDFDLGYRQRRVRFLLAKADKTGCSPAVRQELARLARDFQKLRRRTFYGSPETGAAMATIRQAFAKVMIPAAADLERLLDGHALKLFFDRYEDYDQVTFPILYETQVGEAEPVEVFRVSPLDARSLIDETAKGERRRKLAGDAWFHFGAFLKRDWRVNDLMWGRLDGAERIIRSVLPPGSEHAARLIRNAQIAILRDRFGERAEEMWQRLKTDYEVDRRLGAGNGLWLAVRLAWAGIKMMVAAAAGRVRVRRR